MSMLEREDVMSSKSDSRDGDEDDEDGDGDDENGDEDCVDEMMVSLHSGTDDKNGGTEDGDCDNLPPPLIVINASCTSTAPLDDDPIACIALFAVTK